MTDASTPIAARFGSGQAVRRLEDGALLQGQGRYTDDAEAYFTIWEEGAAKYYLTE